MSHDDDIHVSYEPHDRLTLICDRMTDVLDEPGNEDIKAIVMLDDGVHGGIVTQGYTDQREAFVDAYTHLKAMAHTVGIDLSFVGIPQSPEGI
jgi:hypothetical protein